MTSDEAAGRAQDDAARFAADGPLVVPRGAAWRAMSDGMDYSFTRVREPTRAATSAAVWAGVRDVVDATTGVVRGDP